MTTTTIYEQIAEYRDTPIVRNDRWQFGFRLDDGNEWGSYRWTDTFEAAKAEIDAVKRVAAKSRKLNLPVLVTEEGRYSAIGAEEGTITGIHLRTGRVMGVEDRNIYPPVDWIRGVLVALKEISIEEHRLRALIKPFEISTHRTKSFDNVRMSPEAYAALLDELEAEVADKKAKAEEGR